MRNLIRMLPGFLLAGLLLSSGCGKKEEQQTRFNQALGGTPIGVPTAVGPIDTGILGDQTNYKPAGYERLETGAPAGGPASGTGGPEAQAVRDTLSELVSAVTDRDIDLILDLCVSAQVAALRNDFTSTFYETTDTLDALQAVVQDKATDPDSEAFQPPDEIVARLGESILSATSIELVNDQNAVATINLGDLDLPDDAWSGIGRMVAASRMFSQMAAGGTPPVVPPAAPAQPAAPRDPNVDGEAPAQPATPGLSLPEVSADEVRQLIADIKIPLSLRKSNEEWRLVLPLTVTAEHAEFLNDCLLVAKDLYADMTQRLSAAATVDEQVALQTATQAAMSQMGAIMGLVARWPAFMQSVTDAIAAERDSVAEPADQGEPAEEAQPTAEEPDTGDPNSDSPPPPGGRQRRP
jgi:hypothetical protein